MAQRWCGRDAVLPLIFARSRVRLAAALFVAKECALVRRRWVARRLEAQVRHRRVGLRAALRNASVANARREPRVRDRCSAARQAMR